MLMWESGDGVRTATTRQCAGAMIGDAGVAAGAGAVPAGGGVGEGTGLNSPSGTNSAVVTVACDNRTFFNPSHGVAVTAIVDAIRAIVKLSITTHLLKCWD